MRTVDYSALLNGSAALAGLGKDDIGVAEFALFRGFHDRRLQQCWEIHAWPELCPTEQRYFRRVWNAGIIYAAGEERFDVLSQNYYQSLQGENEGNPPTTAGVVNAEWWALCQSSYSATAWAANTNYALGAITLGPNDQLPYQCIFANNDSVFISANWGLLTPFNRHLPYELTEDDGTVRTPMGELLHATDRDWRVTTRLVEYPFVVSPDGFQFVHVHRAHPYVWAQYRLRRPELTADTWDSTKVYTSGQQVYFVGGSGAGNFWTANITLAVGASPDSAPSAWDVVPIPYAFRNALIQLGYADWLTADGQATKAQAAEGQGMAYLELEIDKLVRQQRQARRLQFTH